MIEQLIVENSKLKEFIFNLKNDPQNDFDVLISIWARDLKSKIEISYLLNSSKRNVEILISTQLNSKNPKIETVSDIYKSANWEEREIFDLFGVEFINHPNLERLLLPKDWKGFPLRKNYEMNDERLLWNK